MNVPVGQAGAILSIDLDAIVENWRRLCARAAPSRCAAVVKADAYGLGAIPVSQRLLRAGCRDFFVAHLGEALTLRAALGQQPRIMVLNGTPAGTQGDFTAAALTPIVNTMGELAGWRDHAARLGRTLPILLQFDSGMSRLGLSGTDTAAIAGDPTLLDGLSVELVMSHLACADEPDHPANRAQLEEFSRLRALFPDVPASLANSSGIFLGDAYHFDLCRPGAALYGLNPTPHTANPMRDVVRLDARVVQTREITAGSGIGYGHRAIPRRPTRLATVSIGYADGLPRSAVTFATFRGETLPLIGTISMDTVILDITDARTAPAEGDFVTLIGPDRTTDTLAAASGTIGYEILTRLGRRFHRVHREA